MSIFAEGLSRRGFLTGSVAVVAGAALPRASSGTSRSGSHDPALDQIADILGGWSFDWGAGARAWEAAGKPGEGPAATGLARLFIRRSHAIQSAMQAEKAGAEPPSVVAALLHDIGHVFAAPPPAGREAHYDDQHELVGALWLRNVFVEAVSEPVLRHVPAKRYLVATRKEYWDHLKQDSKDSLMQQGGPMKADEIDAFRALPFWQEGVDVRTWDDNAKAWLISLESLDHYLPHLEASLGSASAPG